MSDGKTIELICVAAKKIFATRGYDGLSMRTLATESGIGLSSIYHFFENKDVLLKHIFDQTNRQLGVERRKLRARYTAAQMLADLIEFQFKHMEDIVFVLKYYLQFRAEFLALPTKNLPAKSYLHIEEVLYKGLSSGEFAMPSSQVEPQARIITHAINGFLLECYPAMPKPAERARLVRDLTAFVMRSLTNKEVLM